MHSHTNLLNSTKGHENEIGSDYLLGELQKGKELILTIILYLTMAEICVLLVCAMSCFEGLIIH